MYRIFYFARGTMGVIIILVILIWLGNIFYRRACKRIKMNMEHLEILNKDSKDEIKLGKYHKDNPNRDINREELRNKFGK